MISGDLFGTDLSTTAIFTFAQTNQNKGGNTPGVKLYTLILDGCSVNSSSSVRNLGVLFDCNLSLESHVSNICKTAFFKFTSSHLHIINRVKVVHIWCVV